MLDERRLDELGEDHATILGWTFVAVGVVGFFLTGFGSFFGIDGETLILFGINPAHNLLHLILGVIYLTGARATEAGVRAVVVVLSSAYLLVGVLGLLVIDTSANILAINQADNVLHLAVGGLGLGVIAVSAKRGRNRPASDARPGRRWDAAPRCLIPPASYRTRVDASSGRGYLDRIMFAVCKALGVCMAHNESCGRAV